MPSIALSPLVPPPLLPCMPHCLQPMPCPCHSSSSLRISPPDFCQAATRKSSRLACRLQPWPAFEPLAQRGFNSHHRADGTLFMRSQAVAALAQGVQPTKEYTGGFITPSSSVAVLWTTPISASHLSTTDRYQYKAILMPNRSKHQKPNETRRPPHAAPRAVTELCHPSARPEMSCVSARCMPAGLQGKHPSRALHLSPIVPPTS